MKTIELKNLEQIKQNIPLLEEQYNRKNIVMEALGWLNTFNAWGVDGDVLEFDIGFNSYEDSPEMLGCINVTQNAYRRVSSPIDNWFLNRLSQHKGQEEHFVFTVDKHHPEKVLGKLLGEHFEGLLQWHPQWSIEEKLQKWDSLYAEVQNLHKELRFYQLVVEAIFWLNEFNSWGMDNERFLLEADYDPVEKNNVIHKRVSCLTGDCHRVDKYISDELLNNLGMGEYEVTTSAADPWKLLHQLLGKHFAQYHQLWLDQQLPPSSSSKKRGRI